MTVLLYYITDRKQFPGDEQAQRHRLLDKVAEAAAAGVDLVQLREKDLPARDLEVLALEAMRLCRNSGRTRLLVNSRTDVALAAGADGVHLTSHDISPADARALWDISMRVQRNSKKCVVGVSCHTPEEVRLAESNGADFAVFGPVFLKLGSANSQGTEALRRSCQRSDAVVKVEAGRSTSMPVLALGGITLENAPTCLQAGAAGIAGIRLFQENDVKGVLQRLRSIDLPVMGSPASIRSI